MENKLKVKVDPRVEMRDFPNKIHEVPADGVMVLFDGQNESLAEAVDGAGWSTNDPGVGRAILLPDGRELLHPVPVAPPVSIAQNSQMSVNDLVEQSLRRYHAELEANAEAEESMAELFEFDDDFEFEPTSPWEEPTMAPEYPEIPKESPPPEPAPAVPPKGSDDPPAPKGKHHKEKPADPPAE